MLNIDELRKWVGRTETVVDRICAFPSRALAATLDRDDPAYSEGSVLPPLWHWLHFLPISPLRETGADGHPARGGFLPPVPLPRRMWAGSRIEFLGPLRIGATARKTSTIINVDHKSGRSGELVFVTVRHEYESDAGLAIRDEHDIVYREAATPGSFTPQLPQARADCTWRRSITPDPMMLFRYSALTFNTHRIHYDMPYVTGEEGYPGLVVHGPLIATLLLDLLRRELPAASVKSFAFRAVSPLFALSSDSGASAQCFEVRGKPSGDAVDLWAVSPAGCLAMEGKAAIA